MTYIISIFDGDKDFAYPSCNTQTFRDENSKGDSFTDVIVAKVVQMARSAMSERSLNPVNMPGGLGKSVNQKDMKPTKGQSKLINQLRTQIFQIQKNIAKRNSTTATSSSRKKILRRKKR